MKHTPGPWRAIRTNAGNFAVDGADGLYLAKVFGDKNEPSEANARLIAAAPELLAACKAALGFLGGSGRRNHMDRFLLEKEFRKSVTKAEEGEV